MSFQTFLLGNVKEDILRNVSAFLPYNGRQWLPKPTIAESSKYLLL